MSGPLIRALTVPIRPYQMQKSALSRIQKVSSWIMPSRSNCTVASEPDVIHQRNIGSRTFILNRPEKLNALDLSMVQNMTPQLMAWEASAFCKVIILKGNGGKALCAGGDVASIVKLAQARDPRALSFFKHEYELDHFIATMETPFVSIMDGITMGGGVGLSVHAPFRIATENTIFAMPETTIGFFPDVGGGFFLPRLDGEIGTYLALTSELIKGMDALFAGVATHYVPSDRLPALEERLSEIESSQKDVLDVAISEFADGPPAEYKYSLGYNVRTTIDRCFKYSTIEAIFSALDKEAQNNNAFALKTLRQLKERSPIALKVTLEMLRRGKHMSITDVFESDYQLAQRFLDVEDFREGVTARLISKPPKNPQWKPAKLEDVTSEQVALFFDQRSPEKLTFLADKTYVTYPHQHFSLPNDEDIRNLVPEGGQGSGSVKRTLQEVKNLILRTRSSKPGSIAKVDEIVARCCVEDPVDKTLTWEYSP